MSETRPAPSYGVAVPTPDEVRAWPVTVTIPAAGRCFGLGRDTAYDLARSGRFPVPILVLGDRKLRVARAALMAALGLTDLPIATSSEPASLPPASHQGAEE